MAEPEVRIAPGAGDEGEDVPMEGSGDTIETNEKGNADVAADGDEDGEATAAAEVKPIDVPMAFVEYVAFPPSIHFPGEDRRIQF